MQRQAASPVDKARAPDVTRVAHQLAAAIGPHRPWVFLARDEATDEISVVCNQTPNQTKKLLRHYLGSRTKR